MLGSVLVVDDNQFVRQAIVRFFKSQPDFQVCGEAHDGLRAIEMAESLHPDLIVMDISMPVMNGIEASRELQKRISKVPIIVFSEYSDALSEQEAKSAGISARVSKVDSLSVLLSKARTLLERSERPQVGVCVSVDRCRLKLQSENLLLLKQLAENRQVKAGLLIGPIPCNR